MKSTLVQFFKNKKNLSDDQLILQKKPNEPKSEPRNKKRPLVSLRNLNLEREVISN